jgi:hypothetical protein
MALLRSAAIIVSVPQPYLAAIEAGHGARLDTWSVSMKKFILAAFAVMTLSIAIAPDVFAQSTLNGDTSATRMQQTGVYEGGGN